MTVFKVIRFIVLGACAAFAIAILVLSGLLLKSELYAQYGMPVGDQRISRSAAGFVLGVASVTLLFIFARLMVGIIGKGALISLVWFELAWTAILAILWLAASSNLNALGIDLACQYVTYLKECQLHTAMHALCWCTWVTCFGWFSSLLILAVIAANRGNPKVWSSPSSEYPLSKGTCMNDGGIVPSQNATDSNIDRTTQSPATGMPALFIIRTAIFYLVQLFALAVLGIMIYLIVTGKDKPSPQMPNTGQVLGIVSSVVTIFISIISINNRRKEAFSSQVWWEVAWTGILWVLWFVTARFSTISDYYGYKECQVEVIQTWSSTYSFPTSTELCQLYHAVYWLASSVSYFLMGWFASLLALAMAATSRGEKRIWGKSTLEYPFCAKQTDIEDPSQQHIASTQQAGAYIPSIGMTSDKREI
ncbi:hypothetical protein FRC02_008806 [Tulasnella sp. 418]|nr:hypothetical protein FRC02_008806 [Tulasnella sp. 418]